jgi:hypothetical protein
LRDGGCQTNINVDRIPAIISTAQPRPPASDGFSLMPSRSKLYAVNKILFSHHACRTPLCDASNARIWGLQDNLLRLVESRPAAFGI